MLHNSTVSYYEYFVTFIQSRVLDLYTGFRACCKRQRSIKMFSQMKWSLLYDR